MPIFYSNYLSRSRTLHYSWNIYQSNWFILPTFKLHKVSLKLLTSNQEKRGLKWIQKNSKVSHLLLRLDLTPKTQKVKNAIQYVTFRSETTNLKRSFSGLGVLQSCVCYQDPRPLLFPQLPTISINLDSFLAKDPPRLQIFLFLWRNLVADGWSVLQAILLLFTIMWTNDYWLVTLYILYGMEY